MTGRWVVFMYFSLQVFTYSSEGVMAEPFTMSIVASGYPYFKIVFALGTCHKALIFQDQQLWSNQRLNRIMDIYYKSDNPDVTVSRVEIQVVLNNTNCFAYSTTGVGHTEFVGALMLPANSGLVFYNLMIFSCDISDESVHCLKHMLQFYVNPEQIEDKPENEKITGNNSEPDQADPWQEEDHEHEDLGRGHRLCRYEWSAEDTTTEITETPEARDK